MNFRAEDLPYFEDLKRMRDFLEREVLDFPVDGCFEAASLVKKFAGPPIQGGIFRDNGYSRAHLCNYDPKRKIYVDLTLNQFEVTPEKISILPELNCWFLPTREYNRLEEWQILSPSGYLDALFRKYALEQKMRGLGFEPRKALSQYGFYDYPILRK